MSELNNCFKEAVCVDVQRVFDSCSDRDCIYELPITLTPDSPPIRDDMDVVRTRCVEVEATCISVYAVPFKPGYYSVDITYRFFVTVEAFTQGFCRPQTGTVLCGTAFWNKRVILFGGEGNSKVFTSDQELGTPVPECDGNYCCCARASSMPRATVRVVDPIALDTKFTCIPANMPDSNVCPPPRPHCKSCCPPCPPVIIDCDESGEPPRPQFRRVLTISLGLFSIVQLSRPVSIIVPAYDYCIPCKDCTVSSTSEAPCDVFDRIAFPADQFFPQPSSDATKYSSCCAPSGDSGQDFFDKGCFDKCGFKDKCDHKDKCDCCGG